MHPITDVFFDYDYTLLDFDPGNAAAMAILATSYGAPFAQAFDGAFQTVLQAKRVQNDDWANVPGGQEGFTKLRRRFTELQGQDMFFPWSRQICAMYAAEQINLPMTPAQAAEVAVVFWQAVAERATLYPDTLPFLQRLDDAGIPYHIFTGSDGHLRWQNDVWAYDPDFARTEKAKRLETLVPLGVRPASVTTGDPYEKPDKRFYEAMLRNAEIATGKNILAAQAIAVGDSFAIDVQAPVDQLNLRGGYWLRRNQPGEQINARMWAVQSLADIPL
ncbi:MAG: HAD family hydrolase [Patescibacteria group bacterium]